MRVAIISYVAGPSSNQLADALRNNGVETDVFNLKNDLFIDNYSHVLSYGCSADSKQGERLNKRKGVLNCVDKTKTFDILKEAGCATVPYTTKKHDIPKGWDWVVIRSKVDGRKAEGLDYAENIEGRIPDGVLFSEFFEHKYEYRIMVFRGIVVGRYFKREEKGDWFFNNQPAKGFEEMDDHCIRGAKALGIDYVGFDIVAKTKKNFRILEANSGPRITDEAENAIVEYYINL